MKNSNYSDWSKEDLVKEIKKLKKRKKYGIVWDDEKTKEEFDTDSKGKLPILKEVKSKEIQTNGHSPTNILIEGDNYHALSVLNYTHVKQVDVIYIDPPYNTGSEFTFNDDIVELEDTYRHSKWLSFMKRRLVLARKLLKNSGVIFISIDDNEVAQLKLLCDEIFGENNFIACNVWQKRYSRENREAIGDVHEFILVYAPDPRLFKKNRNLLLPNEKQIEVYKNPNNDPKGRWRPIPMTAQEGHATAEQFYEIKTPSGKKHKPPKGRCWSLSEVTYKKYLSEGKIYFGKNKDSQPNVIRYLSEVKGFAPWTWWPHNDVGHTDEAKKEIHTILGYKQNAFETPKPMRLLKRILQIASNKNSIILDFFAGSGTTGHAILEMNKLDGGNRKFILCTNNENNICTDVCYPRIRNGIKGYTNTKKEKVKGLGGNLKYFKTDFVDGEPTDKNKKKMVEQCTEMLCMKENCFDEIKQTKKYSIFKNHEEKYFGIIYDDDGIEHLKKQIKSIGKKFSVYVFSLDDSAREEEFEDVTHMVNLKPIPEVILNVYRRILR